MVLRPTPALPMQVVVPPAAWQRRSPGSRPGAQLNTVTTVLLHPPSQNIPLFYLLLVMSLAAFHPSITAKAAASAPAPSPPGESSSAPPSLYDILALTIFTASSLLFFTVAQECRQPKNGPCVAVLRGAGKAEDILVKQRVNQDKQQESTATTSHSQHCCEITNILSLEVTS
jgi:hypothetical protein